MTPRFILSDLVSHLLAEIERDVSVAPQFQRFDKASGAWRSLVFCILSSQVRVSMANNALRAVLDQVPFFEDGLSCSEVYSRVKRVLQDDKVRYRFPDAKARQISHSWFAFAQLGDGLYPFLDSFADEKKARAAVAALFPGLGMKQASMFLRDIGYSDRLCIVDTHILWYCSHVGSALTGALTTKRYIEIENYLLAESDRRGVSPGIFDSVVWVAARALKANQCMMQFA